MAYIKFKELSKTFEFKDEIDIKDLPDYVVEYVRSDETMLLGYKTRTDHAVFTDKTMILFDRHLVGEGKKIYIIPYCSISTGEIAFNGEKTEILLSFDSGYQMHIVFVNMNHEKKENLKVVFKKMMAINKT